MRPIKELTVEREVTIHPDTLSRMLPSGEVDVNNLENADQTYFMINIYNIRTLRFALDSEFNYTDSFSGGE